MEDLAKDEITEVDIIMEDIHEEIEDLQVKLKKTITLFYDPKKLQEAFFIILSSAVSIGRV